MSHKIIGISGISGAGKTTIAQELAKALKATAVFWDDFDDISTSPKDYVAWFHSGQGNEAWDYPALATTLEKLKMGQQINHPALNHFLEPTKHIIFDAPMGRLHEQTGKYIDLWVHIDVPLDVALARRTIRDFKRDPRSVEEVLKELRYYLEHSRPMFFSEEEKKGADLVVDGTMSIEEQVKRIKTQLK
jgi:uridine kinase